MKHLAKLLVVPFFYFILVSPQFKGAQKVKTATQFGPFSFNGQCVSQAVQFTTPIIPSDTSPNGEQPNPIFISGATVSDCWSDTPNPLPSN